MTTHRAQTGMGPLDVTTSDGGFRCVHERGCEPAVYKRYRVGPAAIKTWTLYGANDSAIAFARDLAAARADNEAMRKLLGTCGEALEKIVDQRGSYSATDAAEDAQRALDHFPQANDGGKGEA